MQRYSPMMMGPKPSVWKIHRSFAGWVSGGSTSKLPDFHPMLCRLTHAQIAATSSVKEDPASDCF